MPHPTKLALSVISLALFAALCFAAAAPALAEESEGISVSGVGTAKGRPTEVEIDARVSGEGELANDANVKYRDVKKKGVAALEALKDPNLTIEGTGPTITEASDPNAQQRMMNGMATDGGKAKVQVSEGLKLTLKGADKLEPDKLVVAVLKILDTAKDAGLQIGAPPGNFYQMQIRAQMGGGDDIVIFKIPDRSELERQAYEKAVADARAKAERLAQLNGVKLGRVLYVQDDGVAQTNNGPQSWMAMVYGMGSSGPAADTRELTAAALADIPVTIRLTVKFEIAK